MFHLDGYAVIESQPLLRSAGISLEYLRREFACTCNKELQLFLNGAFTSPHASASSPARVSADPQGHRLRRGQGRGAQQGEAVGLTRSHDMTSLFSLLIFVSASMFGGAIDGDGGLSTKSSHVVMLRYRVGISLLPLSCRRNRQPFAFSKRFHERTETLGVRFTEAYF